MRGAEEQVETNRSEPRPLALPGGLSRRRLLSFSPKLGRRVILAGSVAIRAAERVDARGR